MSPDPLLKAPLCKSFFSSMKWMTRKGTIICDWNFDCSLCMLMNLFSLWKTLPWFLAFLKIWIQFLSYVFNFLLSVLALITWETFFASLLPEHTSFVLGLMSWTMIGWRSTVLVVLAPMIATGHGVVDGSLQATFPCGLEYSDCLSRVGSLLAS